MPDGRSKGCGVVEYASSSDAQRAIAELSNQTLNGRMVYIREVCFERTSRCETPTYRP